MSIRMPPRRRPVHTILAIGLLGAGHAAADSLQPPGWDRHAAAAEAIDTNPDPRVVATCSATAGCPWTTQTGWCGWAVCITAICK